MLVVLSTTKKSPPKGFDPAPKKIELHKCKLILTALGVLPE